MQSPSPELDFSRTLSYRAAVALSNYASRISLESIDRWARALAMVTYDVLRIRRRTILKNLSIAFGDELTAKEKVRTGRASVYHCYLTALEFMRSRHTDPFEHATFIHREYVDQALEKGMGVYAVVAHLGNWELLGAYPSHFIVTTRSIVKPIRNRGLNQYIDETRNANGLYTIAMRPKGSATREICKTMKANLMLGFVLDQRRPGEIKLPFWGSPARTNTSLAALWLNHPAPVLPIFARRTGVGQHIFEALPPIELESTGDRPADIERITTRFNEAIESMIRRCPDQYLWMHNRWDD